MSEERKVGELLDSLGVLLELDDGDMVSDALILAKIIGENGDVSIGIGKSESLTWIDQIGILTAASDIVRQEYRQRGEDDL